MFLRVSVLVALTAGAAFVMRRRVESFSCAKFDITGRGRGMIATRDIEAGELVETCPLLVGEDFGARLDDFTFQVTDKKSALALGHCSLYNHSDDPNVDYEVDVHSNLMFMRATKAVGKGEELFVSYGREWWDSRGVEPL